MSACGATCRARTRRSGLPSWRTAADRPSRSIRRLKRRILEDEKSMHKTILRGVLVAAVVAGLAAPASAGELKLTMQDGRVTIIADNVPLRQILQEWASVGQTQSVHAHRHTHT